MKNQKIREKVLERLSFYSDRFSYEGPCGAKPSGCPTTVCEQRKRHFTDKNLYHTYGNFYADAISSLYKEDEEFSLLELGVYYGGSCAAWCESIPNSFICGVDWNLSRIWIDPFEYKNLTLLSGSHEDPKTYAPLGDRKFDIIIDDGSHADKDQVANFLILKDKLKDGGIYVIEDIYPSPPNFYSSEFLQQFERIDFSKESGRGDDVLLVFRKKVS